LSGAISWPGYVTSWHTAPDIQWLGDCLGPRTGLETVMKGEKERDRDIQTEEKISREVSL